MKIKTLLKFYFYAEGLDETLNGIILNLACASGRDYYKGGCEFADRIAAIIEAKGELGQLWARLDGVISRMTERDRNTLKLYAAMRVGPRGDIKKEIHRAAVKFTRRAGGLISGCGRSYKVLRAWRCLIST